MPLKATDFENSSSRGVFLYLDNTRWAILASMTLSALTRSFAPLARWLDERTPRQDLLLCALLGALNALAMPPVYFVPILLISFPVFVFLLDKSMTVRSVAWKTFLFFFTYHVAGLYWINFALFVDIKNNWWVIPFALSGLPFLMALYPTIATWLWYRMGWTGAARLVFLIVLLGLSEWVRGWAFTGFPWNLWGYAWVFALPVMQTVALIGIYGLTFLTLFFACLPLFFSARYNDRFGRACVMVFAVVAVGLCAWGYGRAIQPLPHSQQPFNIRIVQPNIAQAAKVSAEARNENERRLWGLTMAPSAQPLHMVVWPETALPLFSTYDVRRLQQALQMVFTNDTVLAAGALEIERDPDSDKAKIFNRIAFYRNDGHRESFYDKFHLVPFGEFLPFEQYWPVRPVAFAGGSMQAGEGLKTIHLDNIPPFSPLICYEVLFPSEVALKHDRPAWLLAATNDAWYGNTSGPYQHLAITRTRAIEEGIPVIRAANTGISAIIDPMGRIEKSLALNNEGVIDSELPAALAPTPFSRFGNSLFLGLVAVIGVIAFWQQRRNTLKPAKLH